MYLTDTLNPRLDHGKFQYFVGEKLLGRFDKKKFVGDFMVTVEMEILR